MIFLVLMLSLIPSLTYLCDSSVKGSILPLDEPFQKFEKQIPSSLKQGFGIWFKWQPISPIKPITTTNYCQDEFLYAIIPEDASAPFLLLYLQTALNANVLKIKSNQLTVDDSFALGEKFEGVWIYHYTYFDISLGRTTFFFYQSEIDNYNSFYIEQVKNIIGTYKFMIGGVCDYCIKDDDTFCLQQFAGRISTISEGNEIFNFDNFQTNIENCFSYIDDCQNEQKQILIEDQYLQGDQFKFFESQIMEKQIYQLCGWFKLNYSQPFDGEITIFKVTNNQNENSQNQYESVYLKYIFSQNFVSADILFNSIVLGTPSEYSQNSITQKNKLFYDAFKQWHFIQINVGNSAMLQIFSYLLSENVLIQLQAHQYTGLQNLIFIGGDLFSINFLIGNIVNLYYNPFCKVQEPLFTPSCYYTCKTCNGPYINNCLTCLDNSNRFLQNNYCICQKYTMEGEDQSICSPIKQIFKMLTEVQEEIKCTKPGYDFCDLDGKIICSYGYFKYKNQCVKCPYFEDAEQNPITIACLDCILNQNEFYLSPRCSIDAVSYFNDKENVFEQINRKEIEQEYFEIVEVLEGQFQLQLLNWKIVNKECKEGYFKSQGECFLCGQDCQQCENKDKCEICKNGYFLNILFQCEKCQDCEKCELKNNKIICLNCPDKYYFNEQEKCVQCGQFCASCRQNGFCNYCIDPSKYYISLDGKYCQTCNIQNCKYCYELAYASYDLLYTSLDLMLENFVYKYQNPTTYIRCLKCKSGFVLDVKSKVCEKIDENLPACLYGTMVDSNFDCKLQENSCKAFANCLVCSYTRCYECKVGYYPDFLATKCKLCPNDCYTCSQQNIQQEDFWKWEIMPYYDYEHTGYNHDFKDYATSVIRNDYDIICLTCKEGQIIYQGRCIFGCLKGCINCQIINGIAVCVKCSLQEDGFIKTLDQNNQCQECPRNCAACKTRKDQDIKIINPNFMLSIGTQRFAQLCYSSFESKTNNLNLFFYQNVIVECEGLKKCRKKVDLLWNLYCDQYDENLQNSDNKELFRQNYYIQDFFQNNVLNQIENWGLINYLNDKSVNEINMNLNIIQGNLLVCECPFELDLNTNLFNMVFILQNINLKIFSSNNQKVNLSNFDFHIAGFSSIFFENLRFLSLKILVSENQINQMSFFKCDISGNQFQDQFYVKSKKIFNLDVRNFTISYVYYLDQNVFTFNFDQDSQGVGNINIVNLIISYSVFENSSLIFINIIEQFQEVNVQMSNIQLINFAFVNSNWISSEGAKNIFVGTMFFDNFIITNAQLKNSKFFSLPNTKNALFQSIQILENSKLQDRSYFILGNQFQLKEITITSIYLYDSFLMSNQVDLFYQTSENPTINITLINFEISQINYYNSQSILQLIKYENRQIILSITLFKISQALYEQNDLHNFISQEQALLHLECQICNFDQIQIQRDNGLPEISILNSEIIVISNSIFTQKQEGKGKILHPSSFECYQQSYMTYKFYFLFIGQYINVDISNLQIVNAVAHNQPFIILQGTDIMRQQTQENIKITNSIFKNNIMTISSDNVASSLFQIISEQQSKIIIQNTQFANNHLNAYVQDLTILSSTTIFIEIKLGSVILEGCIFQNNIITNSSNSILYVKAEVINISNTRFFQNNYLNFTNLIEYIIFETQTKQVNIQELQNAFQVLSNGGNGFFLTSKIYFTNILVNQSYSMQGGAFYINTFGSSLISIKQCNFSQTQTSLISTSTSFGGCLFIDAQASKLTLFIEQTYFDKSFSHSQGGALYIIPSDSQNYLQLEQVKITNCYSTQGSFFYFEPQNLKTMTTKIIFNDIFIEQTKLGFDEFLSQIDQITNIEANQLLNSNPIFYIEIGNLTFSKFQLHSEVGIFLAEIEEGFNIEFFDIYINDGIIFSSPLLKINLQVDKPGKIKLSGFQILNLKEYVKINQYKQCDNLEIQNSLDVSCLHPYFQTDQQIIINDDSQKKLQNQFNCNQNQLSNTEKSNFSLISISNVKSTQFIKIESIFFQQVQCYNCTYGLISLINIEKAQYNNIQLNELVFKNCNCGLTGCLTIINDENQNHLQTNLISGNRILQQQNYQQLIKKVNLQVFLSNSNFDQNTAQYGGGVCVIGVDLLISNSNFERNNAEIGGAIYYFNNQTKILFFQTSVIQNKAKIAGGIFLYNASLQETKSLDLILGENNSTISGNDILEKPRSLALSVDGGQSILLKQSYLMTSKSIIEKTLILPYKILGYKEKTEVLMLPSGIAINSYTYFDVYTYTNIPYNLTFRILALNKIKQIETTLEGSQCTLSYKIINTTNQKELFDRLASLSLERIIFDTETKDFNLDKLIISFNPYYEQEVVLRIYIKCDFIQIPIYSKSPPFLIDSIINDYQLFIDIKTFPCQLGEYFNYTSEICIQCNSQLSQYQVEKNATICQFRDDQKIKSVQSSVIELKENFWRAYFYSTQIEECYHLLQNCLGGWKPGDDSCTQGHIGALCEQCDLYNIRGDGYYATSQPYKCGNCDQIKGNIISITLISAWTVISVLMSVSSTIETIKEFLAGSYLIIFGIRFINKKSSTAVLIKVFTNYLQIVQTITTFQLKVPEGVTNSFSSVGNPIEQMAYSLDCFLIKISDITIIYFRIVWSLAMAISYISTFFILLIGAILLNKVKFNVSMVTTALIYIFIFLQPNIIQALISLVSFRVISDVAWVQGNVSYRYDTSQHKVWLLTFCLPILLSFGIFIPGLMFYGLRAQKHQLDTLKTREAWGYLYNEYKIHAYYWEFIKILQKEFIIIVLSYYEDHIAIKASLVFLFIFAYSYLTTSVTPYMTGELNKLDIQSTTVCAISIILGSSIYTAQNSNLIEIVYPFYFIIAVLNAFFLLKILFQIILAHLDNLHEQIDKLKDIIAAKFSNQISKYPQLLKLLETKKVKDQRIKGNFGIIKSYLMSEAKKILKLKKNQETEIQICQELKQEIEVQNAGLTDTSVVRYPKPKLFKPTPINLKDRNSVQSLDSISQQSPQI